MKKSFAVYIKTIVRKFTVLMMSFLTLGAVFWTVADYGSGIPAMKGKAIEAAGIVQPAYAPQAHKEMEPTGNDLSIDQLTSAPVYQKDPIIDLNLEDLVHMESSQWTLLFEDTFDGPYLDKHVWRVAEETLVANNELQAYDPSCVEVNNGSLVLTAALGSNGTYLSGKVDTKGKLELTSGKVDIRMKLCRGKGLFPAAWLFYEGDSNRYMEIDIMESLGHEPETVYGVLHMQSGFRKTHKFSSLTLADPLEYHVYSVEWNKNQVQWLVDGKEYYTAKTKLMELPMYLILNLAVGGDWPGSPNAKTQFPASIYIDYVRVYAYTEETP